MSGETQQQDETEGDGRAWTPPPPHETPETLGDRYSSNLSQRPRRHGAYYAARAQSLAVATRGENTSETLAAELETALDDADALRDALRRRDRRGAGELEIGTVDGFQGREKEVVVVSCVRSNPSGEIGFLAESRRMNVAITRARRQIVVVGDSATLGRDPFLAGLIAHLRRVGSCPDPLAFA